MSTVSSFLASEFKFSGGAWDALVLDVETTIEDGSPMPQDGARLVAMGIRYKHTNMTAYGTAAIQDLLESLFTLLDYEVVLVGHNLKFDLRHLMNEFPALTERFLDSGLVTGIWDTMVYEYIDSGQSDKNMSLSDALKKRGITEEKNDVSENYFKKGLGADHVPEEELIEYLEQDLLITCALHAKQWSASTEMLRSHMFVQGWALRAYADMEHNGIPFDVPKLREMEEVLGNSVSRKEALLDAFVRAQLGVSESVGISNRVLSTVFFGEPGVPVKVNKLVGKYKNGKPKYKKELETLVPMVRYVFPEEVFGSGVEIHNKTLGWKMDDKVLDKLAAINPASQWAKMAAIIRALRAESKVLNTYATPLANMAVDGLVHHNINMCVTSTGRTSSSNPNGQNMPDEIRKCVSYPGLKILQVDFSQLELCAAAQLSGDPMLISDVQTKDVHFETGRSVLGWKKPSDMDKDSRRMVKGVNFGTIYGGSAPTLAEQTGSDLKLVHDLQAAFKRRYGTFTAWQKKRIMEVKAAPSQGEPKIDIDGQCYYLRYADSVTGRKYAFRESRNKYTGRVDVAPSAIVNYPVQGFATGDIIPLYIAYAFGWRTTMRATYAPFNAVHDSIVGTVTAGSVHEVSEYLKECARDLKTLIHGIYCVKMVVDLKVDIEVGDTWS